MLDALLFVLKGRESDVVFALWVEKENENATIRCNGKASVECDVRDHARSQER
jgi:hypothetical protein